MKEIKFRAWFRNKMYYGAVQWHPAENGEWLVPLDGANIVTKDAIPMQYTGLKDKNGKEGYHKDIVKLNSDEYYSNNTVSFEELVDVIGVIDWDNYGWSVVAPDKSWYIPLADTDDMELEIIGDIYSNPELLKGDTPQLT